MQEYTGWWILSSNYKSQNFFCFNKQTNKTNWITSHHLNVYMYCTKFITLRKTMSPRFDFSLLPNIAFLIWHNCLIQEFFTQKTRIEISYRRLFVRKMDAQSWRHSQSVSEQRIVIINFFLIEILTVWKIMKNSQNTQQSKQVPIQ